MCIVTIMTFRRETELAEMYEMRQQQHQQPTSVITPPSLGSLHMSHQVLSTRRRLQHSTPTQVQPLNVFFTCVVLHDGMRRLASESTRWK